MSQSSNGFDQASMEYGIGRFLKGLGLDTETQHLKKTPARVTKAWIDFFGRGYLQKPEDVLNVEFNASYTGLVIVKKIPFVSHCCHHLIPFHGIAKIGYHPDKIITGLSKLARVLDIYAARLQVQEDLTQEVADALMQVLKPKGAGVILEAEHMCMTHRGVQKPGSVTITSCLQGTILEDPGLKQEFLNF